MSVTLTPIEPIDTTPPTERDVRRTLRVTLAEADCGVERREQITVHRRCLACRKVRARSCRLCGGHGTVAHLTSIDVTLAPGTAHGAELVAPEAGHELDDTRGDVILRVEIAPHPSLTREGDDLHTEILLPATLAAAGATLEVEWLDEPAPVVVPPGTRTGDVIRVRGWGTVRHGAAYAPPPREKTAYRTATTERGDLLVRVAVERPLTRLDRALAWLAARLGLR
jgi:DnaJ-class molecular chaperone